MINFWRNARLNQQFVIVSSFVVLIGMSIIAAWVGDRIKKSVIHNSALSAALYVDHIITPTLMEFKQDGTLSSDEIAKLDGLFEDADISNRISTVKIWNSEGRVIYSDNAQILNVVFPVTKVLATAFEGEVAGEFEELVDEENTFEREQKLPLLEVYSPVRNFVSNEIIAVAEFYIRADSLKQQLRVSVVGTWAIVALVSLFMISSLFLIVRKGSHTIDRQRDMLQNRISELSVLKDKLQNSSRRSTRLNEKFLKRLGADLHDGPAQHIGLALLKLGEGDEASVDKDKADDGVSQSRKVIQGYLNEALDEIRQISAGLVLPEIENMELEKAISWMIENHTRRTGQKIEFTRSASSPSIDHSVKIGLCRFVQEGLNNSFRHSNANYCEVFLKCDDFQIEISVVDDGGGFDVEDKLSESNSLGLIGIQERIESMGGEFLIESNEDKGVRLTARFYIQES